MQGSVKPDSRAGARMSKYRMRLRREIACDHCKAKKIRCNRIDPDACANCLDRRISCTTSKELPRSRKGRDTTVTSTASNIRLTPQDEARRVTVPDVPTTHESFAVAPTVSEHAEGISKTDANILHDSSIRSKSAKDAFRYYSPQAHSNYADRLRGYTPSTRVEDESHLPTQTHIQKPLQLTSTAPQQTAISCYDPGGVQETAGTTDITLIDPGNSLERVESYEDDGISSEESTNWEYHGPRSCLSLCSKSGIDWVENKIGNGNFHGLARTFTADITRRLKLSNDLSTTRAPDPDREDAWRFTSAYFQHALDASMGVVHQTTFESQLAAYLSGTTTDFEIAWHALRNAIYATGCRIHLSETRSVHEANRVAWTYFENALALHTQILLFKTSLVGVQALTVMAYYSQHFGTPCLEYMLCNNALALALSKGLHRKPPPSWNLTISERVVRNCLFWALYCLEKQIEKQSGRPSTINDDEVTCELPETLSRSGSFNLAYLTALVRLARFASVVTRRLSSVQVLRIGAYALVEIVAQLDEQLNDLKLELEPIILLGKPLNPDRLKPGINHQQAVYLHCFYNTTLLDIHNTLIYPWSKTLLGLTPHRLLRVQVEKSIEAVMRTCHTTILTLQYVHIDAATPVLLSFITPIYVLTDLFICVLQNPLHDRVTLALSLMELGAAFFTRLHIASDWEVPMQFAKELTTLARETVQKAESTSSTFVLDIADATESAEHDASRVEDSCHHDASFSFPTQSTADRINREELDFEQWSTLIPTDFDLDGLDFH